VSSERSRLYSEGVIPLWARKCSWNEESDSKPESAATAAWGASESTSRLLAESTLARSRRSAGVEWKCWRKSSKQRVVPNPERRTTERASGKAAGCLRISATSASIVSMTGSLPRAKSSGWHLRHGRRPAACAASHEGKKRTFSGLGFLDLHEGRQ
jgi:hypothetical protein